MSKDLIGDLSEVRLFDIMRLLVDGKKSGMVVVEGADRAELYLEGGSIVHGRTDSVAGDDAILAAMDLDAGRVLFNWQLSAETRTVDTPTEQLMSGWAQREEEWRKIKKVMASSDTVFSIVVDSGGGDRLIPGGQWSILALCDGTRSVSDVARLLGRSVFDVSRAISEMVGSGVLEKVQAREISKTRVRETIDGSFFETIETELKKVLGPIARVVMSDTLEAFEESRDAFPKDRVQSLIRTISEQIADEDKRERFGRAIYIAWVPGLESSEGL